MLTRLNGTLQILTSLMTVLSSPEKEKRVAIALAVSGVLLPGLHKFYLRQWGWGLLYLILLPTHIPQVASLVESLWYSSLDREEFEHNFNAHLNQAHLDHVSGEATTSTPLQGEALNGRRPNPGSGSQSSSSQPPTGSKPATVQSDFSYFVDGRKVDGRKVDGRKNTGSVLKREATSPVWAVSSADRSSPQNDQTALPHQGVIDVNRATLADWLRLPGLTANQGRSLVALQAQGVQFHCLEDLAAALSLSIEQLQPHAAMLAFYYYEPKGFNADDIIPVQHVNPNQASIALLMKIPGVDAALALQIVHHRTRPYRNLADLQQRLGLAASQVEQLMHYLRF